VLENVNRDERGRALVVWGAFVFGGAGAILGLTYLLDTANLLILPVAILICGVAFALSVMALIDAGEGAGLFAAAAAICLVDLGFGRLQGVVLAFKGIAYLLTFFLALVYLARAKPRLCAMSWATLIYCIFSWATFAYSVDRWTTAYTGFALVALGLTAIRFGTSGLESCSRLINFVRLGFGFFLVASIALYIVAPSIAVATEVAGIGRVAGFYGSPNSLGGVAGFTALLHLGALLWPQERSRLQLFMAFGFLAVALLVLGLSGSRNASAATACASLVLLSMRWRRPAFTLLVVLSVAVLAATTLSLWSDIWDFVLSQVSRTRSGGDIRNLTGRTDIWAFVLKEWSREPLLGHGLGATRIVISEGWASQWGKTTATAHNALLESLLDLGVVGTAALVSLVGICSGFLFRAGRLESGYQSLRNVASAVLCFVLIFGIAEKSFAGTPSTATAGLFVAVTVAIALRRASARPST
jgi:O-antigen ligase